MSAAEKCKRQRLWRVGLAVSGICLFGLCGFAKAQDQSVELLQLLSDAPGPPGFVDLLVTRLGTTGSSTAPTTIARWSCCFL